MNELAVVIPSKTAGNLIASAEAVWRNESSALSILVVDDGLKPTDEQRAVFARWDSNCAPVWMSGEKPFVFARNANHGIRKAGRRDVVLLNDDAILETRGGFAALQRVAAEHPEYGVIAATCNHVGNINQHPRGVGLRDEPRMVCFVCVLIPRSTIDAVGLLDERFVGYGCDDDDYCLRVRNAGLKIGIFDGCYVDHGRLASAFRGSADASRGYSDNLELFKRKWGVDNWGNAA